jgi:formylglycine-generating enzyme required for sulfatase activity
MKLAVLIFVVTLGVQSALPQEAKVPLGKDQVMDLVEFGMDSAGLVKRIKEDRIDFEPTGDHLEALRKAGDQGELAVKTKPGAQALKVSLKGKKDFEQGVTLTAPQTSGTEARLEDIGPTLGQVRENSKDGLKYVWIPSGTFMMGCSPGDNECRDEEKPSHQVTITKGFWFGQTPVTVGAYKRFTAVTGRQMPRAPGSNTRWANENMPMVIVNWDEAQAYCGWIGGRLPTDAEWEYAARGESTEARYGNLDDIAWYHGNSGGQTHDVGQKRANGFGLYDVLGNVLELVSDWYDGDYYRNSPPTDPQGPASGEFRVLRGASSYSSLPRYVRVSIRDWVSPGRRDDDTGFRCVREVSGP